MTVMIINGDGYDDGNYGGGDPGDDLNDDDNDQYILGVGQIVK